MNPGQHINIAGGRADLAMHGRAITLDSGAQLDGMIHLMAEIPDPDRPAQAKTPIYSVVSILIEDIEVAAARAVSLFTEESGKWHRPYKYAQPIGSEVWHRWQCEAQRS